MALPTGNRAASGGMAAPMRVSIVLPTVQRLPVGGYKISYEYANRLALRGFQVTIVHPAGAISNNADFWRRQVRHVAGQDRSPAGLVPWFDFDPDVRVLLVPYLNERWLPEAEVTLFTGWSTVKALSHHRIGRLERLGLVAQIVMDYELWLTAEGTRRQRMERQLRRPGLRKVAISSAASGMLESVGSSADGQVTLGIELEQFTTTVDPARRSAMVGFPYRGQKHKGALDAFRASELVTRARPEVRWACFGGGRGPTPPSSVDARGSLPAKDLVEFYNSCSIFVLPSWAEGWGLPAAEAMACGAAVVTTANGGTEGFAVDGENALLVPPKDPEALAEAVIRLVDDRELRLRLAEAGRRTASTMTWDRATDQLCALLGLPQAA